MWSTNHPHRKLATACVIALAMLSATTSAPGGATAGALARQPPGTQYGHSRLGCDRNGRNAASIGMGISSAATYYSDVRINPSAIHKGAADHHSIGFSMTVLSEEATPHEGQECICFLRGRSIVKLLPKTEENLKALATMSRRVESLMSGADGRLLGSGTALGEAVQRSDTIETVVFDSYSPRTISGATGFISRVDVTPTSPFFKGKWADMIARGQRTYGLSGPAQEALPGIGEQYIVFVRDRIIFKVDWNTSANRNAIDQMTTQH